MWNAARFLLAGTLAFCLTAKAVLAGPALLMEPSTGLVLYAEDADLPWRPASLTKLMTAYIAFEAIRDGKLSPEDVVVSTQQSQSQPPSKLGLPLGAGLKVDVALKVLLVKSANDVAIMLANKIAGNESEFVDMMNATAKRLGMTNTHFVNPNGLPNYVAENIEAPEQSVTSARDMAILASMILKEFPQYTPIFSMMEVPVGKRIIKGHNELLKVYDGADGMKTGFICAAGYNVVASATRNGRQLIAVVLGANSGMGRAVRAAGLFDHGFEIYPWKAVLAPTLATLPVATPEGATAPDLHNVVCNAKAHRKRRGKRPKLKPGHRLPSAGKKKLKRADTGPAAQPVLNGKQS